MDGALPVAGLIDVNGTLYGTTQDGGVAGIGKSLGTVFSFNPSTRAESVLYSFCSLQNCADGAYPSAGLLEVNSTLYGTTQEGGSAQQGTVFALDPSNNMETVLYSFCSLKSCADGRFPMASLIEVNGTLYGTTQSDGANAYDGGTVFGLDPATGTETVLHSFCSQRIHKRCVDGASPVASLIDVNGTLYGTTQQGGESCGKGSGGCGTVFSLDPQTGSETVVFAFEGRPDGAMPYAGLIELKGKLYGTTANGGSNGYGSVFSIRPR